MTSKEMVDVVIPYDESYTPAGLLTRAKKSVERQTVDTNVIVCRDDGVAEARNHGLRASRNRYVAFLDADDYWKSSKLSEQLSEIKQSGNGICLTNSWLLSAKIRTHIGPKACDALRSLFVGEVYGLTSTVLIDTELVDTQFDPELERREDHLFMITAATEAGLSVLEAPLTTVDRHGDGLSACDSPAMKWRAHCQFYDKAISNRPELQRHYRTFWYRSHRNIGYLYYRRNSYFKAANHYLASLRYRPVSGAIQIWGSIKRK